MVRVVVHVIPTADSHSVENIVEFNSQLGLNSLTQKNFLATARVSVLSTGLRKPE